MYESDITRFIRELKAKNPQIAELQRKNRATWWDRPQDLQRQREFAQAKVPQPAYVYFPLPTPAEGDKARAAPSVDAPTRPA